MITTDRKRRPRRIAADEAHSWARNLRLGNLHAKMVLSMLSLYVDGDGVAFVGIPLLAEDCELSADTVRRRLAWLEDIGAVARVPQWLDENGNRNGLGRGKRTTDLIKLLFDADQDDIEIRAAGGEVETPAKSTVISPSQQQGLNPAQPSVSTRLGLGQPSQSGEGLISEPEPEPDSPKPPEGAGSETDANGSSEPEHFGPAWLGWPGHEVMRRDLALAEFCQLPLDKQVLCRAAVPEFAKLQIKLGRKHPPNFHLWIRSKGFEEFPNATIGAAPGAALERRWICGDELAGVMVALKMAERPLPRVAEHPDLGRGFWSVAKPRPDLAALAKFEYDDPASWPTSERGSANCAAWRDRLKLWLGGEIEPRKVFLEPFDASVHGLSHDHPNFKFRKSSTGLPVPAPWPPHRDGTWASDDDSEVA